MLKVSTYILCFFWFCSRLIAADSSLFLIQLDSLELATKRVDNLANWGKSYTISPDKLAQSPAQSLSELLSMNGPIYIKNYGPGNISSTSFRGGNASHTAVLWNGFKVNSSLNGMSSLNLFPVNFIDELTIQYGGSSALWGSGAIGGAIHLNNKALHEPENSTQYALHLGSFNLQQHHIQQYLHKGNYQTKIKAFWQHRENNFTYLHPVQLSWEKQHHAQQNNTSLLWENYYQINPKQKINLLVWIQDHHNQIPPTFLQQNSKAKQQDQHWRISTEWNYQNKNKSIAYRSAWFNEINRYWDPVAEIEAHNQAQTQTNEVEFTLIQQKKHHFTLGAHNQNTWGITDNYTGIPQQYIIAFFGAYHAQLWHKRIHHGITLRKDIVLGNTQFFTYNYYQKLKLHKYWEIQVSYGKAARIPTFNDRFWVPGGNPDLTTETGLGGDIGMVWKIPFNTHFLRIEGTYFSKKTDNWLMWLPLDNYWQAQNLLLVWSRGLETRWDLHLKLNQWKLKLQIHTNYVLATNERSKSINDASVHKQLIYTPIYQGNINVSLSKASWRFTFQQNYTGYTYTSSDHSNHLPPYHTANLGAQYTFKSKKFNGNCYLQAHNFYHHQYQVVAQRPMPGIQLYAGIQFKLFNPISILKPNNL